MSFTDTTSTTDANAVASGTTTTGNGRTVTAFFDSRPAAQKAIDDLVGAGIARERITMVEGGAEPVAADAIPSSEKGFWANLRDLFMPDEDRHSYGEGLRRGGFLLAVRDDGAQHDAIVDILDREGTVDMDERETLWQSEGWNSNRAGSDLASMSSLGRAGEQSVPAAASPVVPSSVAPASTTPEPIPPTTQTGAGATVPTDELRETYSEAPEGPLVPPQGDIPPDEAAPGRTGRRDAEAGRARVRSYLDSGL